MTVIVLAVLILPFAALGRFGEIFSTLAVILFSCCRTFRLRTVIGALSFRTGMLAGTLPVGIVLTAVLTVLALTVLILAALSLAGLVLTTLSLV